MDKNAGDYMVGAVGFVGMAVVLVLVAIGRFW
jgi:hypothetical protein